MTFLETFGHCKSGGCRMVFWCAGVSTFYCRYYGFDDAVSAHVADTGHTIVITPIARTVDFAAGTEHIEKPCAADFWPD